MCTASAITPAPFRLPLNDAQFRRALQAGHGRALMHVVRHGVGQSLEAVVDACIHNRAYDAQCEGDRARWMLEIIDAGHVEQHDLGQDCEQHRPHNCSVSTRLTSAKRPASTSSVRSMMSCGV